MCDIGKKTLVDCDNDTVDCKEERPVLTYRDSEGRCREEAPCERCIRDFSWNPERRSVIDTALEFNVTAEEYDVCMWHKVAEQYGSSDWHCFYKVVALQKTVTSALGLFALDIEDIRALRGSIHIALAAGIFTNEAMEKANVMLRWLTAFGSHLHNHHRDENTMRIEYRILSKMSKPRYCGAFGLEDAWAVAPKLVDCSLEEAVEKLREDLDGMIATIRDDLAQRHGGRRGRLSVLEEGISNALKVIDSRTDDWLRQISDTDSCYDLLYLSEEIHQQVFLIDELMSMNCSPDLTFGMFETIEKIKHLIDWDECGTLKAWMGRRRETEDASKPPIVW